jgi:hypothetical protein
MAFRDFLETRIPAGNFWKIAYGHNSARNLTSSTGASFSLMKRVVELFFGAKFTCAAIASAASLVGS